MKTTASPVGFFKALWKFLRTLCRSVFWAISIVIFLLTLVAMVSKVFATVYLAVIDLVYGSFPANSPRPKDSVYALYT